MTDSELGAALYRNNELYVRAMQSAYTPENAGRLRYLRAEYFGLTSVNLSHKKARPIIYIIGGLIVLPIAAEVIGEAALAEFLLEETGEYVLEEAGVPVPIINDPTDIVEYAFKKGSKKTLKEGTEEFVKHEGDDLLYRFDVRTPKDVEESGGFMSWGDNMDLREHVTGKSIRKKTSGYVSTSKYEKSAVKFAEGREGFLYSIKNDGRGIDVNKTFEKTGKRNPVAGEEEVAFPKIIFKVQIIKSVKINEK